MHNHLLWGGDDQRLPEEALLSLALEAWLFSILPETDSRFSLFFPEPRFLTSLPTQRPECLPVIESWCSFGGFLFVIEMRLAKGLMSPVSEFTSRIRILRSCVVLLLLGPQPATALGLHHFSLRPFLPPLVL